MWNVAGGSMSSTIATVDTFSKAIDGPRSRMVRYGQNVSAAGRRGGISGGRDRGVRRPWAAGPAHARDARRLPDRRAVPHVSRAGADPGGGSHGPHERLACPDGRLVLPGR